MESSTNALDEYTKKWGDPQLVVKRLVEDYGVDMTRRLFDRAYCALLATKDEPDYADLVESLGWLAEAGECLDEMCEGEEEE